MAQYIINLGGKCRKCGKQGHKAADCKSDKKGVCFNCGKDGHFARDCPEKKKDENETPNLKVVAFVDSNYATNKETRKSVSGYLVTVGGCLVSWTSKTQPSVTLSSTEAEYVSMSMCTTEVKFVQMLMKKPSIGLHSIRFCFL